jgi:NAD(P)-dependent dehydrogenase (short-subunit alcohol dehydrogenase family)
VSDMNGRVSLITGASSGIGRATAQAFASKGTSVMVTAQREDDLSSLKVKEMTSLKCLGAIAGVIVGLNASVRGASSGHPTTEQTEACGPSRRSPH